MNKATLETSVGIFVIIGLICVSYMSIKLGGMGIVSKKKFVQIFAKFDSVSGLQIGSVIDIAGVEVGRVATIQFDNIDQVAIVKMNIKKKIYITKDTIASIRTSGLIGNKYIKLIPGVSNESLKNGAYILETESALDLEELISKYLFRTTQ